MTIEMKKVWFVDGQIIEQEIPESDIYKRPWNIDACKEYVKQLRDKTRANTAEHAAEAIEYLLTLAVPEPFNPDWDAMAVLVEEQQRMAKRILELEALLERQTALLEQKTARIVDLQTHIENFDGEDR